MESNKMKITEDFIQRAREYRELQQKEPMYVKVDPEDKWKKAAVVAMPRNESPWSYTVPCVHFRYIAMVMWLYNVMLL